MNTTHDYTQGGADDEGCLQPARLRRLLSFDNGTRYTAVQGEEELGSQSANQPKSSQVTYPPSQSVSQSVSQPASQPPHRIGKYNTEK
ncbi:hypothetical protein E2C01_087406 [Portunus trituberculatus]|uniref:Uncharacterized protein n=1 Tax=Portunus trituberculatus TaxID=210409 RepID=A0A5B7JJ57_PORTR|nr:hypothetical protein [Portunus trituberculatus]